jgi:outer membrane protein assembly factor BamB
MKRKKHILWLVIMLSVISIQAQTVYQWRGPARDGFYNETGLLSQWPEKGLQLLWFTENLGPGYAAPVVTNDKLLIMGVENGNSVLFSFNLKGDLLWKAPNGKEFTGSGYASNFPGARSTPTVIGDLVYATSGLGRIACFNINTGKEIWAVDMVKDLKGYQNEFGYSESVVTDDKTVYCFPGGKDINVAALDRFTGKTVWISKATGDTTHFVSPILVQLPSRKVFISVSRHYIFGVDCSNGELLWKYRIAFKYDGEHCNTPIYDAPYLYLVTAEDKGKGTIKLELSLDGKSVKEIWTNPQVKNNLGGFVVADNKLFVTSENRNLNMLDLVTGEVVEKIKAPYGCLILAGNKFICYGNNGDVSLFNYTNGKLIPGGTFKITKGSKEHFSHPVISNGVLYIRHGEALMAFKIR